VLTFGLVLALIMRAVLIALGAALLTAFSVVFLLFALDSIPAVFGVTSEAFTVFTANALALLGLRVLFFLVKGLLDKLDYLSTGLSVILAFIGVKLVLHRLHVDVHPAVPEIPTLVSLAVILGIPRRGDRGQRASDPERPEREGARRLPQARARGGPPARGAVTAGARGP
jgi:predicted tellurium resistance membrane protein TerC